MSLVRRVSTALRVNAKSSTREPRNSDFDSVSSLPTVTEEDHLATALVESFGNERLRLESELASARTELGSRRKECARFREAHQRELIGVEESHEKALSELKTELEICQKRVNGLEFSNRLYKNRNDSQSLVVESLQDEKKELEDQVRALERELHAATQAHEVELRISRTENFEDSNGLEDYLHLIGKHPDMALLASEYDKAKMEIFTLNKVITDLRSSNTEISAGVNSSIRVESQALGNDLDDTCDTMAEHQSLLELVNYIFGPNKVTLRLVITMKYLRRLYDDAPTAQLNSQQSDVIEILGRYVMKSALDEELELERICEMLARTENERYELTDLRVVACIVCRIPKLASVDSSTSTYDLSEFLPRYLPSHCCGQAICIACLGNSVHEAANASQDWARSLDSKEWIICPNPACCQLSDLNSDEVIQELSGTLNMSNCKEIFQRASILRSALQALKPRPSPESLDTMLRFHAQLTRMGVMFDFFDVDVETTHAGDCTPLLLTDLGRWKIDTELPIPVFTTFFRRDRNATDCSICCESFYGIEIRSEDEWKEATQGFHGAWMWNCLWFPAKAQLACDHELDFCKQCIATHLQTQLEQAGRSGCDRLSCPRMCGHFLSPNEIKTFTCRKTYEKYEQFTLLNYLSIQPNFRWCLRDGCESGQVYELDGEYIEPHIYCEECQFEMCFVHQMPWHEGVSCQQFDNQRTHGDPDYEQTQQYLRGNTKPCPGPGCGLNVEKDGGCYHMTCKSCRHEFCWECLAPYSLINPRPGDYVRAAHYPGCWFLSNTTEPTQVVGNALGTGAARAPNPWTFGRGLERQAAAQRATEQAQVPARAAAAAAPGRRAFLTAIAPAAPRERPVRRWAGPSRTEQGREVTNGASPRPQIHSYGPAVIAGLGSQPSRRMLAHNVDVARNDAQERALLRR